MRTWNTVRFTVMLSILAALFTACGPRTDGEEAGPDAIAKRPEPAKEPVILKLFVDPAYLNDDEIKAVLTDPLKMKAPHIRLDVLRPSKEVTLETMIAAGTIPDLHISWNGALNYLTELGIVADLEPHLKNDCWMNPKC